MFLTGAGMIFGLLQYDGRTFNLLLLLALTLGIQWVFLLAGALGFLTWGWWRPDAFLSLAQRAVFGLGSRLARRSLGDDASRWWRETAHSRRLYALPALRLTQTVGIAFNLGTLLALTAAVLFLSIRVGWETTTPETMIPAVKRGVALLSTPWSWLQPGWAPTGAAIEASLIRIENGKPVVPGQTIAAAWIPFILASLVVWGLLPRLLLRLFFGWRERRALATYSFQDRIHREWWRRLTDVHLDIETPVPADGTFALLWGGMNPTPEELRRACLQQLRLNPEAHATHGAGSLEDDTRALDTAASFLAKHRDAPLVIVAEAWSLSPKEFHDFHRALRERIGEERPIQVLLTGVPPAPERLAPAQLDDVSVWETFAASLDDAALYLRPMKALDEDS